MTGFEMRRLGLLMEPDPSRPEEVEGVLNPAAARGPEPPELVLSRLVYRSDPAMIRATYGRGRRCHALEP